VHFSCKYSLRDLRATASGLHCVTLILKNRRYPLRAGSNGIIVLAGNPPQNPHDKELRGQNLENKGVATGFFSALTGERYCLCWGNDEGIILGAQG
jgi:hypothetical protein